MKHAPLEHQLQSLEEFWDSGYPRLGEAEASGWVLWFGNNQSSAYHGPAISIAKSSSISPNLDPYTAWAQAEIEFDERCRLPLRPDDDEDGSDPYTAVIFTDIKSLLVPPFKSISARRLFRYAWLSLLGLHIPGTLSLFSNNDSRPDLPMQLDENRDDRWAASHFIRQGYRKALFPLEDNKHQLTTDSVAGALVGRVKTYSSSFGPVKNWPKDALHPLDVGLRDEGLGKTHGKPRGMLWDSEDMENLDKIMVKELFAQLKIHEDDDLEWDILSLTFEAASSGLKRCDTRTVGFSVTHDFWLSIFKCTQALKESPFAKHRLCPTLGSTRTTGKNPGSIGRSTESVFHCPHAAARAAFGAILQRATLVGLGRDGMVVGS